MEYQYPGQARWRMRINRPAALLAVVVALSAGPAFALTLTGEVVGVADGDTLTLLTADKVRHRIRLEGIDAPERRQPYSQVSRQSLADMVHRRQVTAECAKRDRYGRQVCRVLVDGQDAACSRSAAGWRGTSGATRASRRQRIARPTATPRRRRARPGVACGATPILWRRGDSGKMLDAQIEFTLSECSIP